MIDVADNKINVLKDGIIGYLRQSMRKLYSSSSRAQTLDTNNISKVDDMRFYKRLKLNKMYTIGFKGSYWKNRACISTIMNTAYNFKDSTNRTFLICTNKIMMKLFKVINLNDILMLPRLSESEITISRLVDYLDSIIRSIYTSYITNFIMDNIDDVDMDSIRFYKLYNKTDDLVYTDHDLMEYAYQPAYSFSIDLRVDNPGFDSSDLFYPKLTNIVIFPLMHRVSIFHSINLEIITITDIDILQDCSCTGVVREVYSFSYANGEDCYKKLVSFYRGVYQRIYNRICYDREVDSIENSAAHPYLYILLDGWCKLKQIMKFDSISFIDDLTVKVTSLSYLAPNSNGTGNKNVNSIQVAFFNLMERLAVTFKEKSTDKLKCIYFKDMYHSPMYMNRPAQFRPILTKKIIDSDMVDEVVQMNTINQNNKHLTANIRNAKVEFIKQLRTDPNSVLNKSIEAITNMYIKDVGLDIFSNFGAYQLEQVDALGAIPKTIVTISEFYKKSIKLALWFIPTTNFNTVKSFMNDKDLRDMVIVSYNHPKCDENRRYMFKPAYTIKITNDPESIKKSITLQRKNIEDIARNIANVLYKDDSLCHYKHKVNNFYYSVTITIENYIKKFGKYFVENKRNILPYLADLYNVIDRLMSVDPNIISLKNEHKSNKNKVARKYRNIIKEGVLEPMNNIEISSNDSLENFISQCNYYASCDYYLASLDVTSSSNMKEVV